MKNAMSGVAEIVFLFDVDNTLFDNDRLQDDLRRHLQRACGEGANARYWAIFEQLRDELGYADYLGALERLRLEDAHNPALFRIAEWLLDYPFADRLYPHALDVLGPVRRSGPQVVLFHCHAVFRARQIFRSGLWEAFERHGTVFVHLETA